MNKFDDNAQSLASRSLACKEQLKKLSRISQDDQQPDVWARDQTAQFNMWAANAGVFAETRLSLDFLLKEIPETRKLLALLLQTLEKDIIQSQTPPSEVHQHDNSLRSGNSNAGGKTDDSSVSSYEFLSSSDEIEVVAPAAPLSKSRVAVQETIDRLHKLASIIRHSGKKHRQLRIEKYLDKPTNREVHNRIKMFASQKVEHLYPEASKTLQKRMAESIAKRRSRFSYITKHQQKISTLDYSLAAPQPHVNYEEPNTLPQFPDQGIELPIRPEILERHMGASTVLSATEFPKLDLQHLRAIREDRPKTVASAYLPQSDFPAPPRVLKTEISFLCPYCCLQCPAKEARGEPWKQHVLRDFEPYFCVFDDCKHPFESLDSFSALITHAEEEHMPLQWHCTASIHKLMVFSDKEKFEEHMQTHYEDLTDPLLSTLSKHSVRHDTRVFKSCPFCGGFPEELERRFPNQQDTKAQQALQKHVKNHFIDVALILPPIRVDMLEEEGRAIGSSAQGHGDNESNPNEEAIIPSIHCEGGDEERSCDCRDVTKDSASEWLTMSRIVLPIWGGSESIQSLERFDDPGWPSHSRSSLSDPIELENLPQNHQEHISVIKGGWEHCKDISLPPKLIDISTKYEGHLEDEKLIPFVKRYNETNANKDSLMLDSLPYGLKVLAEGADPALDIVAVHGLNGHREKTWTVNDINNDINWLRDLLPSDIPNARILTWGYDANTHSTSQISAQYLYDHGITLVSDLCLKRRLTKTRTCPIIFVAHSLGGIVVKSALIHSDAARQGALEEHRSIKLSTYGIFFMGTPHQGGSGVHFGDLTLKVASIFVTADNKILKHLERDSEWLQQQLGQYASIGGDFVTKIAYETYPTRVAGKTIMVVPHASAIIPGVADAETVAIPADHFNMVKFTSREDLGYEKVSGHLQLLAIEAPGAISARWLAKQVETIHQWLDAPLPSSNHNTAMKKKEPGTGAWFIKSEEFADWKIKTNSSIWIHGIPGCGKTILCSTIIHDLVSSYEPEPTTAVAYFYFDFTDADKRRTDMLIRSLIVQFAAQCRSLIVQSAAQCLHLPELLQSAYLRSQSEQKQPTTEELTAILRQLLNSFDNMYILLDALDECVDREDLLEFIKALIGWNINSLHVLMTSRKENDIAMSLEPLVTCQLSFQTALVDADIRNYILETLSHDPKLRKWPNDVKNEILNFLMGGSDGMFRWVICQLESLRKCLKLDSLRRTLNTLPKTLDDTYERILYNIDEEYGEDASKVFQWLCFSQRPMRLEEMVEVIAIGSTSDPRFSPEQRLPDPRDILTICSSLARVAAAARKDKSTTIIETHELRLAHFSIKEYLISDRLKKTSMHRYHITPSSANVSIAKSCLVYLLYFENPNTMLTATLEKEFPLLRYAAEFWPLHYRCIADDVDKADREAVDFLGYNLVASENWCFINWLRVFDPDDRLTRSDLNLETHGTSSPLYYMSYLGVSGVVRQLLNKGADVDAECGYFGNALSAASLQGHGEVVRLLLENGADVNAKSGRALRIASKSGHEAVMRLLLRNKADVLLVFDDDGEVLKRISVDDHEAVIQLLLEEKRLTREKLSEER